MSILVLYVLMGVITVLSVVVIVLDIKFLKYLLFSLWVLFLNLILYLYIWWYMYWLKKNWQYDIIKDNIKTYKIFEVWTIEEIKKCETKTKKSKNKDINYKYIVCSRYNKAYIPSKIYMKYYKISNNIFPLNNKNDNTSMLDKIKNIIIYNLLFNKQ